MNEVLTEVCGALAGGAYPEAEHECWQEAGHGAEHVCFSCGVRWHEEVPC